MYLISLSLFPICSQSNLHSAAGNLGKVAFEGPPSRRGQLVCLLSFIKVPSFIDVFFFFGVVRNVAKAISSRPFNHAMTGSGPVSLCACVSECELWPH